MVSRNTIGSHARNFLSSLASYREDSSRPVIFVAHSMGGLVVKDVGFNDLKPPRSDRSLLMSATCDRPSSHPW